MTINASMFLIVSIVVPGSFAHAGTGSFAARIQRQYGSRPAHTHPAHTRPAHTRTYGGGGALKPSGNPDDNTWGRTSGAQYQRWSGGSNTDEWTTYGGSSYSGGYSSGSCANGVCPPGSGDYYGGGSSGLGPYNGPRADLSRDLNITPPPPSTPGGGLEVEPDNAIGWSNRQMHQFWNKVNAATTNFVVLDFYKVPCDPCERVAKLIREELEPEFDDRVTFLRIEIKDDEQFARAAGTFRSQPSYEALFSNGLPSLVILQKKDGAWKHAHQWSGAFSVEYFRSHIERLSTNP